MSAMPADRILRLNAVLERTGLSPATLYHKIQNGTFPPPSAHRHALHGLAPIRRQRVDAEPDVL